MAENKRGEKRAGNGFIKEMATYKWQLILLCFLVMGSSGMNLFIPRMVSGAIDAFGKGDFVLNDYLWKFVLVAGAIFLVSTLSVYFSSYFSEKVARDLREKIAKKLSRQTYKFLDQVGTETLLTNITSDVDAVKMVISMGVPIIFSSVILIIGSVIIMFVTNWSLALPVVLIIFLMFFSFKVVFGRIAGIFRKSQEVLDKLNRVINESIIASALIRVVYGQYEEVKKFAVVSGQAKDVNMQIVNTFATLIPLIGFFSNLAVLCVLWFGGNQVIGHTLSLGEFMAFYNYISMLVTPIVILGFVSNIIVRAMASFGRIQVVLSSHVAREGTYIPQKFHGKIEFRNVSLVIKGKSVLKDINFVIEPGQKTALIGPTGAGKTLIIYLIGGLIDPTEGEVWIDGREVRTYDLDFLRSKIALVFQDSVIFSATVKENVVFRADLPEEDLQKIIHTAALDGFVSEQKEGLEARISERGASLSGGQKQRISLARALALKPDLLLLDDFTARVDLKTEETIFARMGQNYPGLATVSVSQKIEAVKDYDHLILLMEGELLDQGKHVELMERSFEYRQIYSSQQSTHHE